VKCRGEVYATSPDNTAFTSLQLGIFVAVLIAFVLVGCLATRALKKTHSTGRARTIAVHVRCRLLPAEYVAGIKPDLLSA